MWLLNNWRSFVFGLVLFALCLTGFKLYRVGAETATLRLQLEYEKQQSDFFREQTVKFAGALSEHAARSQADAAKIKQLNDRIITLNEYAETPQVSGGSCFDGTDTERVLDLWNQAGSGSADPASAPR